VLANCLLKLAKLQYFSDLYVSSEGNSKKFWLHFHHLSTKGATSNLSNGNFTADDISDYFFLSVPYNTVQSDFSVATFLFT